MIDDFRPQRSKPKTIQPLPKLNSSDLPLLHVPEDEEPEFKTPEQAAAEPAQEPVQSQHDSLEKPLPFGDTNEQTGKRSLKTKLHVAWPPTKKQGIIGATLLILLTFGAGAAAAHVMHHKTPVAAAVQKPVAKPAPKPQPLYSNLTGLPISDASINSRPVTAVMIENSPDARPQSGLDQAGVVFEAIAEGGITRFLALFQDSQPDYIGPVRSARPYYVQWEMGFDAGYAHVGGSPEALQDIKDWGVRDLDQFYNAGGYQRISSRYAPHNMYTSMAQLNQLEASKGYTSSNYTGFPRKADSPSPTPNASSIDMNISGYYYNTHYDYDAATDSYKRSESGAPHMELHKDGSQVQIQPKVVVAMVMQYGLEADDHHSQYNVIGTGQAFVFQDGAVTPATWSKTDAKSQLTLTDANGKVISLNRGQTWLTALSAANQVTYK